MSAYDELMSRQSRLEYSERFGGPMEKQSMALLRSLGSKIGDLIASHPKTIAGLSAAGAVGQFAKNYQQDSSIEDLMKDTEALKNMLDAAKASQPEPVPLELNKAASLANPHIYDLVGSYRRSNYMAGAPGNIFSDSGSSPSIWQRVRGFFGRLNNPEYTVSTIMPTYRGRDGGMKIGYPSSMEDLYVDPAGPKFHVDPNGIKALQELFGGKNKGGQQPQQGGNGSGSPSWYDELFGKPNVSGPMSPRRGQGWMGGMPDRYGPGWQDGTRPGYRPIVGRTRGGMDPGLIAGVSPWFQYPGRHHSPLFQSPTQAQPYNGWSPRGTYINGRLYAGGLMGGDDPLSR